MYVDVGRQKILPKPVTQLVKHGVNRRSESQHFQKTQQKSQLRYRKLNATAGEGTFTGMNPLKEFKRQAMRNQLRAGLAGNDIGLGGFLLRV